MNHNIVVRNERIQKVSLSLPVLPSETIIVNDVTNALEHLSGHRWMILSNNQIVGSSVPERLNEDQKFDVAVVRISPNKDRLRVMLSMLNGVLSESAVVWLLGSNDEGIKSLPKTAEDFIQTAVENIPEEPFNYESWDIWTKSISEKTGLKGKNLFMPLRLILTGKDKGPELKNFLPLLDKQTLLRKFGKT